MPRSVKSCILSCLEKDKEDRFKTAAELLEGWDQACKQAENQEVCVKGGALEFWYSCGFKESVPNSELREHLKKAYPSLQDNVLVAIEKALDADGNGVTEYEEYLNFTKDRLMQEILEEFERKERGQEEPPNVFYKKEKVVTLLYQSSSIFGGSKKGFLVLHRGMLEVRKEYGGTKARFSVKSAKVRASPRGTCAIEVCGYEYALSSDEVCKDMLDAIIATQEWLQIEESRSEDPTPKQ